MLDRAAARSAGAARSLAMMARMRAGDGALSFVIRSCTPSVSAAAYTIGFRCQFFKVSCSSSQPSMMPRRIRRSTRSSGVRAAVSILVERTLCSSLSFAISAAIAVGEKSSSRSSCEWMPLPAAIDGCRRANSSRYESTNVANALAGTEGARFAATGKRQTVSANNRTERCTADPLLGGVHSVARTTRARQSTAGPR